MKIVVAGGRDEADFLIGLLLMGKHKIIAINGDMGYCEHLAASYDAASVIYGDPCKEYVMDEAGLYGEKSEKCGDIRDAGRGQGNKRHLYAGPLYRAGFGD